jgi:dCMP deaminase
MKQKFIDAFMDVAERFGQLSSCNRLHVGAIIVKEDRIVSIGYNGMPAGWDNECEIYTGTFTNDGQPTDASMYKTKPEVLHAESNAIAKLARSSESGDGASIFVTHQPCIDCAKLIYQSGIEKVFYKHPYRNEDGVNFLKKSGIKVCKC